MVHLFQMSTQLMMWYLHVGVFFSGTTAFCAPVQSQIIINAKDGWKWSIKVFFVNILFAPVQIQWSVSSEDGWQQWGAKVRHKKRSVHIHLYLSHLSCTCMHRTNKSKNLHKLYLTIQYDVKAINRFTFASDIVTRFCKVPVSERNMIHLDATPHSMTEK